MVDRTYDNTLWKINEIKKGGKLWNTKDMKST